MFNAPSRTGRGLATLTAGMAGSGAMVMGSKTAIIIVCWSSPTESCECIPSQVVLDREEGILPADPPPRIRDCWICLELIARLLSRFNFWMFRETSGLF